MSTAQHHFWPHRHHTDRMAGDLRPGTVLAGLAALIVLTAFIGAVAGAATWGVVKLFTSAVG